MVRLFGDSKNRAFVFLGFPGAGKGEHCKYFKDYYGFYHVEVGYLMRSNPTLLAYTDAGIPCPFNEVSRAVSEEVKKASFKNIVLDGAPRDVDQVGMVINLLEGYSVKYIVLECQWTTAFNRAIQRARPDSTPEIVTKRLNDYVISIDKILDELERRRQDIVHVNAEPPVEEVRLELLKIISPVSV